LADHAIHHSAARGFEAAAEQYERGRPGYPPEAIRLLAAELGFGAGSVVVDLAAGTGKLTRALVGFGAHVVAVEPVAAMRAQLARAVPSAEVHDGTAEAIPVADASADAVLVAQAFHWFDTPVAARELHRVLRPGGGLGVIWNIWDERVDWVARMGNLIGAHRGDTPGRRTSNWSEQLEATGLFTALEDRTLSHVVTGDIAMMRARTESISFVATLPEAERARLLDDVATVVRAGQPENWARGRLEMPYLTHVTWCHAR
jgi:SAM-dependent methyltransferase